MVMKERINIDDRSHRRSQQQPRRQNKCDRCFSYRMFSFLIGLIDLIIVRFHYSDAGTLSFL